MNLFRQQRQDAELRRLYRVKQAAPAGPPALGPEFVDFFKKSVAKRQTRFVRIAECWQKLIPTQLAEHCSLESFAKGTLSVLIDSSPHLYEVKQLLLAGVEQQLLLACRATGLRKITLKPGRWYTGDSADARVRFD